MSYTETHAARLKDIKRLLSNVKEKAVIVDNAGAHNAHYRGKNLGNTFTAAQSAAILAGTFEDLFPGDYWEMTKTYSWVDNDGNTQTTTQTIRWTIGGCNYVDNTNEHKNHIVVIGPIESILYDGSMNPTNTNEGGYVNSQMRLTGLNRAKAAFKASFGEDHILKHIEELSNVVTNGVATGYVAEECTVELMSEVMVYGCQFFATEKDTDHKGQLPIFRHQRYGDTWTWLRNVANNSTFCNAARNVSIYEATRRTMVCPYALIY